MVSAATASPREASRPGLAAPAGEDAPAISSGPLVRFDGVYAAVMEEERGEGGGPLCLAVRFYEDGTSVQAEFFGKINDCSGWLNRDNERLLPGRWTLSGDDLTILESLGIMENERRGKLSDQGWTTTPAVTVREHSGWKIEPAARAGHPPITFRFVPMAFSGGQDRGGRNRRPYFQGTGAYSRSYDYDAAGNIRGIKDECQIQAGDPDQDTLTFTWAVSNGSANSDGPHVVWTREMENGKTKPGEISVEVTDGKGGRVRLSWNSPGEVKGGWTLYKF